MQGDVLGAVAGAVGGQYALAGERVGRDVVDADGEAREESRARGGDCRRARLGDARDLVDDGVAATRELVGGALGDGDEDVVGDAHELDLVADAPPVEDGVGERGVS